MGRGRGLSTWVAKGLNRTLPFGWRLFHPSALPAASGPPSYRLLTPEIALIRLGDGRWLYVDPRDESITPWLITGGTWEPAVGAMLDRLIRPGFRVVEVGANMGYFTTHMATRVGPTGRLTVFEANPLLVELLRRSLILNNQHRIVEVVQAAAADRAGRMTFVYRAREAGGGHLLENAGEFVSETLRVEAESVRLDDRVEGPVDLLRMDAEGSEGLVLEGARALIARSPNLRICMEWDVHMLRPRSDDNALIAWLVEAGFKFWRIEERGPVPVSSSKLLDLPHCELLLSRNGTF